MTTKLDKAKEFWGMVAERFQFRRDNGPIETLDALENYVSTRAAYMAQKSMFGYVKTRMGTKYPEMFRNDDIMVGVNLGKMHMFAACLSDLAIFATAEALKNANVDDSARRAVAMRFYKTAIADNPDDSVEKFSPDEAIATFETRLIGIDWLGMALTRDQFSASPSALMDWAPIADELKKLDRESAMNSVRFAWNNIREELRNRLENGKIADTMSHQSASRDAAAAP